MRRFLSVLVCLVGLSATGEVAADSPRYVIYYNSDASPPTALVGKPYTDVILSFITVSADASPAAPVSLVVPDKLVPALDVIPRLQAEGKRVLISFGGGDMGLDDYRSIVGRTEELADAVAAFVARHGFDGVDIDFEVSPALYRAPPPGYFDGRRFLIDLTLALRSRLPAGALLSHVPQAPYLDPAWHGGPYLDVLRQAGDAINWITIQYYNNPDYDAPVARQIVGSAQSPSVTSYSGISSGAGGLEWPPERTLVGLPVYRDDAANGHLPPTEVLRAVVCPLDGRFGDAFGGLTGWQFSTLTADHRFWNGRMTVAGGSWNCAAQ